MQHKENLNLSRIVYYLVLILIGCVIFIFLGEDGPIVLEDSVTYLYNTRDLPPNYIVYPMFLKIINFFGGVYYLKCVFYIQVLFAFCSSLYVTEWFRKNLNLDYSVSIIIFLFSTLPYGYSLPESVLTHQILTEALALPIFNVFMIYLMQYLANGSWQNYFVLSIITVLLVFIRPHLLILFIVIIFLLLFNFMKNLYLKLVDEKKIYFWLMVYFCCIFCVIVGSACIKESIGNHVQLTDAIAGRVLCSIEEEDMELFEGEELEVFKVLFNWVDSNENRSAYFSKGIFVSDDIMRCTGENTNNHINIILDYYRMGENDYEYEEMVNKTFAMRNVIIDKLFDKHFIDYIVMTICLLPQSFIASVFIQPESIRIMCYILGMILYFAAIAFMYAARKIWDVKWKYFYSMIGTLYTLFMNVVLTNFIFYGAQRYVIYVFGWFYISFVVLIVGVYKTNKKIAISKIDN